MWSEVSDTLMERFRADPEVRAAVDGLEADVRRGEGLAVGRGFAQLLDRVPLAADLRLSSPSHCSPQLALLQASTGWGG